MMQNFLEKIDPFVVSCFRWHDFASDFLAKHLFLVKRTLLIVAHLSLFGFLFPDLRKDFGEMAANVLLVILFLSPFSRIFRMRLLAQMMGIRRELGILMAYLATVHGMGYILDPAWFSILIEPYWRTDFLSIEPRLLFGMLAYLLTIPLLLTSNGLALRFLGGKRWKMLHRLVYGIFFAAIFHRLFTRSAAGDDVAAFFQAVVLVSAYLFVKLLAWKNFIAPLRDMIAHVSNRYQAYTLTKKEKNFSTTPL